MSVIRHLPSFTTIQKFLPEEKGGKAPELSKRRNIIVMADEAHRRQYDLIDGLARNLRDSLPNAPFIGFTGTPIRGQGDDRLHEPPHLRADV